MRDLLEALGLPMRTVDLSTTGKPSGADVPPRGRGYASARRRGRVHRRPRRVGRGDGRGLRALDRRAQRDIGGVISAGGSGSTALVAPAMRALPVGVPKLMVSTVASGNVAPYVGADRHRDDAIRSPTCRAQRDHAQGHRQRRPRGGRHGRAAPAPSARAERAATRPAVGLTMFGVTTPCVQAVRGARGRLRLPRLPCHRHRRAVDGEARRFRPARRRHRHHHDRGRATCWSAASSRRPRTASARSIRTRLPYVGSVRRARHGQFRRAATRCRSAIADRNFYVHNPQVTLMRTTPEENARDRPLDRRAAQPHGRPGALPAAAGRRLGARCAGPALPRPEADAALFDAIRKATVRAKPRALVERAAATSTTRPSPTASSQLPRPCAPMPRTRRGEPDMPRFDRTDL